MDEVSTSGGGPTVNISTSIFGNTSCALYFANETYFCPVKGIPRFPSEFSRIGLERVYSNP